MIYQEWGFTDPPFQTTSLPADALGERLLVGRDAELKTLSARIGSAPKMSTIEGLNGVGKTSVVNVASYRLFKHHVETGKGPLFIPCRRIFQLSPTRDVQQFVDQVLMEVAQTLIEQAEAVKVHGQWLRTNEINRWLNAPQLTTFSGGAWVLQLGQASETNTGAGFERSGFRKLVTGWLETVFPTPSSGGVICMIDNLELLQSSEVAKALLEQLRDELFQIPGLRWVLCGSLGIVYGVASSPRLEGYLHRPIEVAEIKESLAHSVLTSRIEAYSKHEGPAPYLPITPTDFERLYTLLRGNLRSVLSRVDDYCHWIYDQSPVPVSDDDKASAFASWLDDQCSSALEAARSALRPKPLEVFQRACEVGVFSPSDYQAFGFASLPALRPHIRDLENVGLVVSTQDDTDKRRKTIQVTPKGWLVRHALDQAKVQ